MPTVVFQDSFTEASGTVDVTAHTPDIGTGWVEVEDTNNSAVHDIPSASDVLDLDGVANQRFILRADPGPAGAEYDVEYTVISGGGGSATNDWLFLLGRYVDNSNYYFAGHGRSSDNPDKRIGKKVAGVVTVLATANTAVANSDVYKLELRDAAKTLYKNGVQEVSTSDNVLTAAGNAGIGVGNIANASDDADAWSIDNFIVTEVTAPKAPPIFHRPLRMWSR